MLGLVFSDVVGQKAKRVLGPVKQSNLSVRIRIIDYLVSVNSDSSSNIHCQCSKMQLNSA